MNADEIVNKSVEYRGRVLHEAIWLEKHIDMYIARYFCCEDMKKVKEMHLFFLGENRTNLFAKAEVFKAIAEKHDSEWYLSYTPLKPTLFKDLEYIISERNVLAHRLLDTSPESTGKETDEIVFKRYNLKYKDEIYTPEKFDELICLIQALTMHIHHRLYPEEVL